MSSTLLSDSRLDGVLKYEDGSTLKMDCDMFSAIIIYLISGISGGSLCDKLFDDNEYTPEQLEPYSHELTKSYLADYIAIVNEIKKYYKVEDE